MWMKRAIKLRKNITQSIKKEDIKRESPVEEKKQESPKEEDKKVMDNLRSTALARNEVKLETVS